MTDKDIFEFFDDNPSIRNIMIKKYTQDHPDEVQKIIQKVDVATKKHDDAVAQSTVSKNEVTTNKHDDVELQQFVSKVEVTTKELDAIELQKNLSKVDVTEKEQDYEELQKTSSPPSTIETDLNKTGGSSMKLEERTSSKWKDDRLPIDNIIVNLEAPGEMGTGFQSEALSIKKQIEEGWTKHAFNAYASKLISIHRTLPDVRDPSCKTADLYQKHFPPVSVIICFHDEDWSTLLRTIHSVIQRTPPELLNEILLVDDSCQEERFNTRLSVHFQNNPKVKIITNVKRVGTMKSRQIGAKNAQADLLVYVDSHCEVTEGWLEPLIYPVVKRKTTVVIPATDIINSATFEYSPIDCSSIRLGAFDWILNFRWIPSNSSSRRRQDPCSNMATPIMPGGIFAIHKEFFEQIGYYDEKMDIWGGEHIGFSFKIWMCGGRVEICPCSHVGHIFRDRNPYQMEASLSFGQFTKKNRVRAALAWMDEYAEYFFWKTKIPESKAGNVTNELAIKERLKCKSFDWYVKTVYPEIEEPLEVLKKGTVNTAAYANLCIVPHREDINEITALLESCNQRQPHFWRLKSNGHISFSDKCLSVTKMNDTPHIVKCQRFFKGHQWEFNGLNSTIRNKLTGQCLALKLPSATVVMQNCVSDDDFQIWDMDSNPDLWRYTLNT